MQEPDTGWVEAYRGLPLAQVEQRAAREGRRTRVLRPGSIVTMDHVPSRLNVHLDADGHVVDVRAG